MIDIETLGTKSNSVIKSIAAVFFDINTGKTGHEFCMAIDEKSCTDAGLLIDPETVKWWDNQPDIVKRAMDEFDEDYLSMVLIELWCFVRNNSDKNVKVWGNSARFDLGLIENACDKVGLNISWDYWNERDVRTLVSFYPEVKKNAVFKGEKHHPLHDCYHQIAYCSKTYRRLKYNWFQRLWIDVKSLLLTE